MWVGVPTYLICWGLGIYLLVAESRAGTAHWQLLAVGVALLLLPLMSFNGLIPVLVAAISRRLGGHR